MFGVGPSYLFFVQQRIPYGMMRKGWKPWASTLGSSFATAALLVALSAWAGSGRR
jgi:omega-6 fatty acid desaturase (delta-12 desaturase)